MKYRLLSWRYTLLVLSVLAIIGLLAMRAVKRHRPPEVVTAPVAIDDIEDTVVATGTIQPFKLVSVGAQASGRIVALRVALGDHVIKGQVIAEIDPSTQRNALEIAQATLEQEWAQRASRTVSLKQADLAFKRATATYTQDASSQADYEAAEATYEAAKSDVAALDAQIREATLQVDTARVTLAYTKVMAPMDGTVVAIVAPEGQTVNAVQAAPTIVKLASLDTMTVKTQISEADVTRVHPGQKVHFTILGAPDRRYEATLRAVEPAPDSIATDTSTSSAGAASGSSSSSAVYYNGLFDIPNPDGALRISMTAEVNVILAEAKGALTIPTAALPPGPEGSQQATVQVVAGHSGIESRRIRIGINNHVTAQVLEGLSVGERVLVGVPPK